MAKLQVLAALLASLMMISAVAAFRTTITTTVVEDEGNPSRQEGSCQEQVRQQGNFNMCMRVLSEHMQGGESCDELAMVTGEVNPERGQHMKECCRQMENVREECRCEGLRMMMQQQKGQRQQQMQEMMHEAENLPMMCNLGPRKCQFGSVLF